MPFSGVGGGKAIKMKQLRNLMALAVCIACGGCGGAKAPAAPAAASQPARFLPVSVDSASQKLLAAEFKLDSATANEWVFTGLDTSLRLSGEGRDRISRIVITCSRGSSDRSLNRGSAIGSFVSGTHDTLGLDRAKALGKWLYQWQDVEPPLPVSGVFGSENFEWTLKDGSDSLAITPK
jgi:hypothetical protein